MKNKILLKQGNNFVFLKHCMLFVLLLFMGLVSCQKNEPISPEDGVVTPISYAPIEIQDMGYTSVSELQSLYDNNPTEVIHFNVARLIAETELLAGANFALAPTIDPNEEWYLTPLPKVVYNYNNTPKYYEFGYVYHGQIVATITTYAQKEIDGVIAYIFDDPLDYSCPDLDFYVGNYPDRYYGQNGECYLKNCDEELDEFQLVDLDFLHSSEEIKRNFMFEQMPLEDRDAIDADMHEEGSSFDEYIAERDNYWNIVDGYIETNLPHLLEHEVVEPTPLLLSNFTDGAIDTDPESHSNIVSQFGELFDYMLGFFDTGILADYSDPNLQMTRWTRYCGPAACAWVYRGKYNEYDGSYLPIHGDDASHIYYFFSYSSYSMYYFNDVDNSAQLGSHTALYNFTTRSNEVDNGLTACFYNQTIPFVWGGKWEFPLYHGGLNRGFYTATNGQYQVKLTAKPYEWISLNHEPIIIEINCNHYIVAFGYGVTRKNNGDVKDEYFLITDNGSVTSSTNYRPQMRKKNFWNLHYGLKHTQNN